MSEYPPHYVYKTIGWTEDGSIMARHLSLKEISMTSVWYRRSPIEKTIFRAPCISPGCPSLSCSGTAFFRSIARALLKFLRTVLAVLFPVFVHLLAYVSG